MPRLTPEERRRQILAEAYQMALDEGGVYSRGFTRASVAERCGCSDALVGFYFDKGMHGLRMAVYALARKKDPEGSLMQEARKMGV